MKPDEVRHAREIATMVRRNPDPPITPEEAEFAATILATRRHTFISDDHRELLRKIHARCWPGITS